MAHDFMPGLAGVPAAKSAVSDVDGERHQWLPSAPGLPGGELEVAVAASPGGEDRNPVE